MKDRIFKYDGKLFASAAALARYLKMPETTLRSHIVNHKIKYGNFEYRNYLITILKSN